MDNLLELNNVSKAYGRTKVVSSIHLSMDEPKIIALCGGNGAGKSTIIKMITGVIRPTSGSITVNEIDWTKDRINYAKQLGYMPDDFHFQQPLSVLEYLSYYAALKKVPQNVAETLEVVGLKERQNLLISKLSKGMRQRLLLAQALIARPKLLLLDEPTNGLDPHWVETFNEILRSTKEKGQGVLFSTHNLAVAETVADQVIFLKNGTIYKTISFDNNTPRDLSNYYKEIFLF